MADDFKLQETTEGEYLCHSLATGEYSSLPRTLGEFLSYVNNPDDVFTVFKKLQLTVICYTNDGQSGAGVYNYYPNIKTLMEVTEGCTKFNPDDFPFQHVFIVNRNEENLLTSQLTLAVRKQPAAASRPPDAKVDFDLLNSIASEIPH